MHSVFALFIRECTLFSLCIFANARGIVCSRKTVLIHCSRNTYIRIKSIAIRAAKRGASVPGPVEEYALCPSVIMVDW